MTGGIGGFTPPRAVALNPSNTVQRPKGQSPRQYILLSLYSSVIDAISLNHVALLVSITTTLPAGAKTAQSGHKAWLMDGRPRCWRNTARVLYGNGDHAAECDSCLDDAISCRMSLLVSSFGERGCIIVARMPPCVRIPDRHILLVHILLLALKWFLSRHHAALCEMIVHLQRLSSHVRAGSGQAGRWSDRLR